MKYTYVHPWKCLSPFRCAQLTVCVFQGQGPRPARMWFLHRWDQQMHQRHWAGLPCSCQSESGHQGWHLSRGEGHGTGAGQSNAAFPFECLELSAQCNLLPVRSILTGTFLGKILYQPKCVTSGKTPESPGKSRGESRFFYPAPAFYSDCLCWLDWWICTVSLVPCHMEGGMFLKLLLEVCWCNCWCHFS